MPANTPRRYYLLKRLAARRRCLEEDVWIAKQAAQPGAALPSTFPHLSELAGAGYTAREDLDGAEEHELRRDVKLTKQQAKAVLAALAAL